MSGKVGKQIEERKLHVSCRRTLVIEMGFAKKTLCFPLPFHTKRVKLWIGAASVGTLAFYDSSLV